MTPSPLPLSNALQGPESFYGILNTEIENYLEVEHPMPFLFSGLRLRISKLQYLKTFTISYIKEYSYEPNTFSNIGAYSLDNDMVIFQALLKIEKFNFDFVRYFMYSMVQFWMKQLTILLGIYYGLLQY